MKGAPQFESEAALVAAFCAAVERQYNANPNRPDDDWTAYHETAGFDLLMVHNKGFQIGIEAKLSLNAKVLCQALGDVDKWNKAGPDYRAVLVPAPDVQGYMSFLAARCGLTVITLYDIRRHQSGERHWKTGEIIQPEWNISPLLPSETPAWYGDENWHNWLPSERCKVPDVIPDVLGGKPSPFRLTEWKQRAIKLLVLLDKTGAVTRKDMKALSISPTRFTDRTYGFLVPTEAGYVRGPRTPDLKAQHPRNWAEIEADYPVWGPKVRPALPGLL